MSNGSLEKKLCVWVLLLFRRISDKSYSPWFSCLPSTRYSIWSPPCSRASKIGRVRHRAMAICQNWRLLIAFVDWLTLKDCLTTDKNKDDISCSQRRSLQLCNGGGHEPLLLLASAAGWGIPRVFSFDLRLSNWRPRPWCRQWQSIIFPFLPILWGIFPKINVLTDFCSLISIDCVSHGRTKFFLLTFYNFNSPYNVGHITSHSCIFLVNLMQTIEWPNNSYEILFHYPV